ncbi:hypothetical protein [Piscinibacter gummiphilus]|uniref:DUF5710 domain-containing protein n=1 Tax=Piscinibacter gummiphilus TaxID=946333 RepID=A0ABZ0CPD8_9BURK|nr:hypothetical protein [Piscinibacter gummiphilus]WOB06847.1 hypothetical protein RXV79_18215 [Piscinibacter gummiphilus]
MATPAWHQTRVTKKYAPSQPGARKLTRRYGEELVCVRHRQNLEGTVRYTTVELLVEQTPLPPKKLMRPLLAVRLQGSESDLRRRIMAYGAQWDPRLGIWWVPRGVVTRLRLMDRVVQTGVAGKPR